MNVCLTQIVVERNRNTYCEHSVYKGFGIAVNFLTNETCNLSFQFVKEFQFVKKFQFVNFFLKKTTHNLTFLGSKSMLNFSLKLYNTEVSCFLFVN